MTVRIAPDHDPAVAPPQDAAPHGAPGKTLPDAARRALEEAAARRESQAKREAELAREREIDGRGGLDPVRYADWEIKGLTSDF